MNIELYIGTDKLDFDEEINVVFSIGDIRDLTLGNLNKSYTLNVPLTKTNRTILKHSETPGITDEITNKGRLYVNNMLIIAGTIIVLSVSQDYIKVIISADDWMETMKNTNLRDIDFSDEDHELTKTNIVASWSDYRFAAALNPVLIRNEEGDNLSVSGTTTLIEITGKTGNVLTLNVLPENLINIDFDWFAQSLDPSDYNVADPGYTGDYLVQDKITDFDFVNKKITLIDATDFDIGEKICIYSPWANYEFVGDQTSSGIIEPSGSGWRSLYVASGPCWYDDINSRYVLLVNGRSSDGYEIGYAYSTDMENWTIGNSDAPIIVQSDHANFANNVWAVGNIVELDSGRIAFAVTGYNVSNYPYCHIIQMDKDCSNITISDAVLAGHKYFAGGLTYYNGKYVICITNRDNANNWDWTAEMWESDSLTSDYSKVCDILDASYAGNDSIWIEGNPDGWCPFIENDKLYTFVTGTQRYVISGIRGNRVAGLMVYDDETETWSVLNEFAPEIIFPMYFYNIPSEDYGWAGGHSGGYISFLKENEKCYLFCSFTEVGTYSIACLKLTDNTLPVFYRYPMVNFGQLVTPATGSQPHDWGVNDFIPMFRVIDIMEYIFAPWTIVSDWIATTYAKKLYILAPELIADNDFIANKGLQKQVQTASDNQYSDTIDDGITKDFTLADGNMDFKAGTDEAVAYSDADDWYVIPETGTYCFTFIARPNWTTYAGITINSQQLILAIKRTRDASTDTLITETYNYVASDILSGITYTLEAGYIHFEAGDKVFCTRYMTQNLSNSGVTRTITMNFTATTTEFNLTWNDWCRHPGKNKTITASDYMPDILAIDFIRAVKHLANLRFFADYQNQNIYIEPAQTFFAIDGETDLSELQDNEDYTLEPISPNYKKSIILGLIEDEKDKAYMEYKESQGITDQKTITLSSEYAEDGEQEMINPLFAHSAIGFFHEILAYGLSVFKIFGDQEYMETKPYPEYRATGWEPRLVTWEGLTAGISFDIEETTYNTYPKILPADFDDLYDNYWITSIHRIDKNMILTMRIKLPQGAMNQLRTVINDSSQEGFRTRYKLFIRNQYIYGYLNKVTTDGDISECEFILKN